MPMWQVTDSLPDTAEIGDEVKYLGRPRKVMGIRRGERSVTYELQFGERTIDITKLLS